MQHAFDGLTRRKAANLTINGALLNKARAERINLSALLEKALIEELKGRERKKWLEENRESMAAYNAEAGEQGVFSDGVRSF